MRGSVALVLPAKFRFWQTYPMSGSKGLLVTSTPKKQENNEAGKTMLANKETTDPIVAFSRPPPLPPDMWPIVFLWFLQHTDEDEDDK